MDKLIKWSDVERIIRNHKRECSSNYGMVLLKNLSICINELTPVDAIPVVRCKDCIFWDRKHISCEGLARCATGEGGIRYRSHSDYCSKGRCKDRKDEA